MAIDKFDDRDLRMSDEELLDVSGGIISGSKAGNGGLGKPHIMRIACSKCGNPFYADVNKTQCKCPICGKDNMFMG